MERKPAKVTAEPKISLWKDAHQLVAKSIAAIASQRPKLGDMVPNDPRLRGPDRGVLNVHVAIGAAERALRLLDQVIKRSEEEGCTWSAGKEGTTVSMDGATLKVRLIERMRREKSQRPNLVGTGYTDLVPTGKLVFEIDARVVSGTQVRWADTRSRSLEVRVADIVAGLTSAAASVKRQAAEDKTAKDERELIDSARRATFAAARHEEAKRKQLVVLIERAENAARVRAFCDQVQAMPPTSDAVLNGELARWLEWARRHALLLDPTENLHEWLTMDGEVARSLYAGVDDWWGIAGIFRSTGRVQPWDELHWRETGSITNKFEEE